MRKLPEHGMCFVCGSDNPASIGVTWYAHDDGTITGEVTLSDSQQGPPQMAHGVFGMVSRSFRQSAP